MPAWLKKIVLDIMPSVAATIIGAYVVNYYIIPKSPLGASRAAVASSESKPVDVKAADEKADAEKASFERAVADKTAIEKTAEKAASDRAAAEKAKDKSDTVAAEPRKTAPASKNPPKSTSVAATEPAPEDRRTTNARATDMARAAIERLRGGAHTESNKGDTAKADSAKTPDRPQDAPRIQTVSTVATPTIPPMQPLPPAISVVSPNADVFEQGNAVPVMRQPSTQAVSRSDDRGRFTPPADIPGSRPLDLRAQASAMPSDRTSIADDVVSTAKSMFNAVIPR